MKRINKVAILSIATILAAGTFATSLALFTKLDEGGNININGTVGSDSAYTLGDVQTTGETINPEKSITHKYALGIDKSGDFKQDTAVADLALTLKIPGMKSADDYYKFMGVYNIGVDVLGYTHTSWYLKDTTRNNQNFPEEGRKHFDTGAGTFSDVDGSCTFTIPELQYKEGQELQLTFNMKPGATIADMKLYPDVTKIDYSIELKTPAKYDFAYIRGVFDGQGQWGADDLSKIPAKYAMVPDLDAENFTFKTNNFSVKAGDEFKVVKNDNGEIKWFGNGEDNFKVKAETPATPITVNFDGTTVTTSNSEIFEQKVIKNTTFTFKVPEWFDNDKTSTRIYLFNGDNGANHVKDITLDPTAEDHKEPYEFTVDIPNDITHIEVERIIINPEGGDTYKDKLAKTDIGSNRAVGKTVITLEPNGTNVLKATFSEPKAQ